MNQSRSVKNRKSPSDQRRRPLAAALVAIVAVVVVSATRPANAGGVDATDCESACFDCHHNAKTIDAMKACGAITAGCCFAAGRKAPGVFIDCICRAPIKTAGR